MLLSSGIILFGYTFLLIEKNLTWKQAGEIVVKIEEDVMTLSTKIPKDAQIYFLGLPDNLNGVYVFRNGFNESLRLHYDSFAYEIIPLILVNLNDKNIIAKTEFISQNELEYCIQSGGSVTWRGPFNQEGDIENKFAMISILNRTPQRLVNRVKVELKEKAIYYKNIYFLLYTDGSVMLIP